MGARESDLSGAEVSALQMRLLDALRLSPGQGRAELSRNLRVSKPAVFTAIAALLARNLVREQGLGERARWRPLTLLELNARAGSVLGLHLGATYLRVALADLLGSVVARQRTPTRRRGPMELAGQILDVCHGLQREAKIAPARVLRMVLATPGVWNVAAQRWEFNPTVPELADPRVFTALQGACGRPVWSRTTSTPPPSPKRRLLATRWPGRWSSSPSAQAWARRRCGKGVC